MSACRLCCFSTSCEAKDGRSRSKARKSKEAKEAPECLEEAPEQEHDEAVEEDKEQGKNEGTAKYNKVQYQRQQEYERRKDLRKAEQLIEQNKGSDEAEVWL